MYPVKQNETRVDGIGTIITAKLGWLRISFGFLCSIETTSLINDTSQNTFLKIVILWLPPPQLTLDLFLTPASRVARMQRMESCFDLQTTRPSTQSSKIRRRVARPVQIGLFPRMKACIARLCFSTINLFNEIPLSCREQNR